MHDFTKRDEPNYSLIDVDDWKIITYEEFGHDELDKTGEEDDFIFELPVEFGGSID